MGWSLLGRRIRVIVSAFGRWRDIADSLAKKHGRAWAGVVRSVGLLVHLNRTIVIDGD